MVMPKHIQKIFFIDVPFFVERGTGKARKRKIRERNGGGENCSSRRGTTEGRREVRRWEEVEGHFEGTDAGTQRSGGRGKIDM